MPEHPLAGLARCAAILTVCLAWAALASPAPAADGRIAPTVGHYDVTPDKHTLLDQYLRSAEAARYLARFPDMVLVDVRPSRFVAAYATPPAAAGHVPFLVEATEGDAGAKSDEAPMKVNPGFVAAVEALVTAKGKARSATVMLICGSGLFSARAADLLAEAGFANVYSIIDGMEALNRGSAAPR
ncbi:MAG: rhodanese-like domain-containing protein [Hyphomicrobiaceae bacterium]